MILHYYHCLNPAVILTFVCLVGDFLYGFEGPTGWKSPWNSPPIWGICLISFPSTERGKSKLLGSVYIDICLFRLKKLPKKSTNCGIRPGRLTWNLKMMVWKMIFLFNWVVFSFHVNLPGCMYDGGDKKFTLQNKDWIVIKNIPTTWNGKYHPYHISLSLYRHLCILI